MSELRPQLYGQAYAPRIKWSCARCRKRNDRALAAPLNPRESVFCKFCHAPTVFLLEDTTK